MKARNAGLAALFLIGVAAALLPARTRPSTDLRLPDEFASYREWLSLLKTPTPVPRELWLRCVAPTEDDWAKARKKYGPHTRLYIRVFGNKVVAGALAEGKGKSFPVGSVIAKEKLGMSPDGKADGVAIMVKRGKAQFAETGGWQFLYFPPGDPVRTHRACAECHSAAATTDYVFGRYPQKTE